MSPPCVIPGFESLDKITSLYFKKLDRKPDSLHNKKNVYVIRDALDDEPNQLFFAYKEEKNAAGKDYSIIVTDDYTKPIMDIRRIDDRGVLSFGKTHFDVQSPLGTKVGQIKIEKGIMETKLHSCASNRGFEYGIIHSKTHPFTEKNSFKIFKEHLPEIVAAKMRTETATVNSACCGFLVTYERGDHFTLNFKTELLDGQKAWIMALALVFVSQAQSVLHDKNLYVFLPLRKERILNLTTSQRQAFAGIAIQEAAAQATNKNVKTTIIGVRIAKVIFVVSFLRSLVHKISMSPIWIQVCQQLTIT